MVRGVSGWDLEPENAGQLYYSAAFYSMWGFHNLRLGIGALRRVLYALAPAVFVESKLNKKKNIQTTNWAMHYRRLMDAPSF